MQGVESVSALMDGELDSDEAAREIARFKQDTSRRETWDTYHAIGDAMRGEHSQAGLSPAFAKRLSERLVLEPTVIAPRRAAPKSMQTWALSAAASVAAVAAVGWVAMNGLSPEVAPGTMANAPATKPPVVALQPAGPILRAPAPVVAAATAEHVHEYLLAHQGISPSTAIQGVTPYIRTVSNVGNESGLR